MLIDYLVSNLLSFRLLVFMKMLMRFNSHLIPTFKKINLLLLLYLLMLVFCVILYYPLASFDVRESFSSHAITLDAAKFTPTFTKGEIHSYKLIATIISSEFSLFPLFFYRNCAYGRGTQTSSLSCLDNETIDNIEYAKWCSTSTNIDTTLKSCPTISWECIYRFLPHFFSQLY